MLYIRDRPAPTDVVTFSGMVNRKGGNFYYGKGLPEVPTDWMQRNTIKKYTFDTRAHPADAAENISNELR